jgi:hypothetical protein
MFSNTSLMPQSFVTLQRPLPVDAQLEGEPVVFFEQQYIQAAAGRFARGEKPRRAAADDDGVKFLVFFVDPIFFPDCLKLFKFENSRPWPWPRSPR